MFTDVFVQAFLTKLNFCLQKLRQAELAAYLLCFSRQAKWLRFASGNLIATSRTHTHQQTMDDVCITARGPQEVHKLQNQWLPSFSQHSSSSYTDLLALNRSMVHYTPTSVISGKDFSCTENCYQFYFTFLSHCCASTCPQAA